jgi:hypothetical protein
MRDFNQQLKAYSVEMKNSRCPYSEAELDKEIRSVIWNTTPNEPTSTSSKRRIWPAAAIIAAIIIPTAILINKSNTASEIASIDIDGEHIYFACNNGCTPDGTLQNFKDIIQ